MKTTLKLFVAAALTGGAFLLIASCASSQQPVSFEEIEKAQVPNWTPSDKDFFLHGSMSTEFAPEAVLRSFIVVYPDLFPKSDLSDLGLIPDPSFGWPVGFSKSRPAHLAGLMSVGVNCAACHVGEIEAAGGAKLRVVGMTSHFDAESFFAKVMAATWRTNTPERMKAFLSEYLNQCDVESDPDIRASHQKQFESDWTAQTKQIEAAIAADPTGSAGAQAGDLQDIRTSDVQLSGANLNIVDLAQVSTAMLKLFHNMRTALHVPDVPPANPAAPGGGPGRNDAFGMLSAVLFHSPQPYAPTKYGNLWNLKNRPYVHADGNTRSPMARNILAALGLGAPMVGNVGEIYISLIERQTSLTEDISPPQYPFVIDRKAARRGALYYQVSCMQCHDGDQSDSSRLYSTAELGTDPLRAQLFTLKQADLFNNFLANLKIVDYTPPSTPPFRSTQKYWAPSLAGVWARSPYLHNGSVRTLADLLATPAQRATTFHRGSKRFDPAVVGYTDSGDFLLDATKPGNSNAGHDYGTGFTQDQKRDLIEFLKTL